MLFHLFHAICHKPQQLLEQEHLQKQIVLMQSIVNAQGMKTLN